MSQHAGEHFSDTPYSIQGVPAKLTHFSTKITQEICRLEIQFWKAGTCSYLGYVLMNPGQLLNPASDPEARGGNS